MEVPQQLIEWRIRASERARVRREIVAALPRFLAQGGAVRILPPQRTPPRRGLTCKSRPAPLPRFYENPRQPEPEQMPGDWYRRYDPKEWEQREQREEHYRRTGEWVW